MPYWSGCIQRLGTHTIAVTPANTHDITVAAELIREDDEVVYGDSGYLGIEKREEVASDGQCKIKCVSYANSNEHTLFL